MPDPAKLYRLLLRFYPARFREEFAAPLELQFRDDYRGVHGVRAHLFFWMRAIRDLAVSIPGEILHEAAQDLRTSIAVYRRRPLATGLAVIALAMAIGVATGVFSVLNGVMFRSLPFHDSERLAEIEMFNSHMVAGPEGVSVWAERNPYLAAASEFVSPIEMTLNHASGAKRAMVTLVSGGNIFQVLGVKPKLGRTFGKGDEDNRVAVIGYGLWRDLFAGDPGVLGSKIRVNGVPLTVIGVAPFGMDYPGKTVLWTRSFIAGPGVIDSTIIVRLRPGSSLTQARTMLADELRRADPKNINEFFMRNYRVVSLRDKLAGPVRRASSVLFTLVLLVLCVACANVAQLLLSRTNERRQELGVRMALGASRSRLTQQLITEATALTLTGAVLGLPVAYWVSVLATRIEPAALGMQAYTIFDWRVFLFLAIAALLAGMVLGVLPVLTIRRIYSTQEVIHNQPGTFSSASGRTRAGLVALQASLSVVLLAGCIIMSGSYLKLLGVYLGFQTDHIVSLRADVNGIYSKNRELQFYNAVLERLRSAPGVLTAGAVRYLPLIDDDHKYRGGMYAVDSGSMVSGNIVENPVASGYFQTMGIHFIAGRDFTDAERRGKDQCAIEDEVFARQSGLGSSIVGKTSVQQGMPGKGIRYTIIGVVRAARLAGPASQPTIQIYKPMELYLQGRMTFVARIRGSADAYLRTCKAALQQVDSAIPIYDVQTLDRRLSGYLLRPRFYATAILYLSVFALLLAAIGIYGGAANSVIQRTNEIGVRIAVGAAPGKIRAVMVCQNMIPVIVGMAAGVAGALACGRFLNSLMESAEPLGAYTCIGGGLLLIIVALAAVWSATSRVIRLDPMIALRSE
jgi:predicted permease